jgi:plasmid stabilization system protein ParE
MKRYKVEFSEWAEAELRESIEWGISEWGADATYKWARELRTITIKLLGSFPESQPLAPESEVDNNEIRQLVVRRYRLLYNIEGEVVNILHLRGPFTGR